MQTGLRVGDFVGGIDRHDEIMIAESAELGAQARLRHRRPIIDVLGTNKGVGLHGALEPQQGPFAVIDDRPAQELPFPCEGDVVGALCRGSVPQR